MVSPGREEFQRTERETEELRVKIRTLESLRNVDPAVANLAAGLCVRCAQNEAVLPPSVGTSQRQSLDAITRYKETIQEEKCSFKLQADLFTRFVIVFSPNIVKILLSGIIEKVKFVLEKSWNLFIRFA